MADRKPYKFTNIKKAEYLKELRSGLRRGAAAESVGVTRWTVRNHIKEDPEFGSACLEAEQDAIEEVEDALYDAAIAGNVVAIQVILYNRDPQRWADRRRHEHIGKPGEPVKIEVSYEGSAPEGEAEEATREAG